MIRATKTTHRYDLFGELDPRQFEDLVRQLAPRYRPFRVPLDPVGRLGSDEGRDADAVEEVKQGRKTVERRWRLQMKRYQKLGPAQLEKIAAEAVPDPADVPYGLLVATSADVSSAAKKRFEAAATALGIREAVIWQRSSIVDMLQDPRNSDIKRLYSGDERAVDGTRLVPLGLENSPTL